MTTFAPLGRAVAPRPLNVLAMDPSRGVAKMAELGVRRIGVGGALARVAWGAMLAAAGWIEAGSLKGLGGGGAGRATEQRVRPLRLTVQSDARTTF